jgi:TolA-binding protein
MADLPAASGAPSAAEAPPAVEAHPTRAAPPSRASTSRSAPTRAAPSSIALRTSAPARNWTAALASGDFQGILRDAEHYGLRRALAEARSEDLAALADAARYLRREDLARQALIAQRERFPRTERAHEAAFLLGRLTESGAGGDVRAVGWYDRYLGEAPTGAYASEALGRKMTATEKLKGLAAARDIAREYLRRFPHGTYAGAAQALAESP